MDTTIKREPRVEAPQPIRVITVGAFRRRMSLAEKVAIEASTDPVVRVLEKDLFNSSFVDLDFDQLQEGLAYLASVGILGEGRVAELLVDGAELEKP